MPALERALRELESATAAVGAAPGGNFAEAKAAMDRRQRAVAVLSDLAAKPDTLTGGIHEDALRRLRLAAEAGDKTAQQLVAVRSEAMAEWNRWSRIYRALGADCSPEPTRIDCRG